LDKTHRHHIIPRSFGGGDNPDNITIIDAIEHAELHAKDYIAGGIQFDFRHEGWPYLPQELRDACLAERSRRQSEKTGEKNHMFGRQRPDRREAWLGDNNPQRNPVNQEKARQRVSGEGNPNFGKTGEANPFFGKTHTDETRRHLSEIHKANPVRPMLGVNHTDETKEKMRGPRPKMKGKKHWVNFQGKTCRSIECPGPEWQQGRKWRPQ
jgi:hypothetical protein